MGLKVVCSGDCGGAVEMKEAVKMDVKDYNRSGTKVLAVGFDWWCTTCFDDEFEEEVD